MMNKPKFEIDDAVKVHGRPGVYYVKGIVKSPFDEWSYALERADGVGLNALEFILKKASLLDDEAIKAKTVCFGQALEALKMGKKVFREKWTGQILWAWLVTGTSRLFFAKFANHCIGPIAMSNEDLLACDWVIMTEEEKRPYPDPKFKKGEIVWATELGHRGLWQIHSKPYKLEGSTEWWYRLTQPGIPYEHSAVLFISEERISPHPCRVPEEQFDTVKKAMEALINRLAVDSRPKEQQKPDRIPVPENIKFYRFVFLTGNTKGLVSPNGKMGLHENEGYPTIGKIDFDRWCSYIPNDKAYLVPCKRSDLKPGDIGLRARELVIEKSDIRNYSVILDNRKHAFWAHDMDMIVDTDDAFSWYKVIFE